MTTALRIKLLAAMSAAALMALAQPASAQTLHYWEFNQGGANPLHDEVGGLHLVKAPGEGNVGGVSGQASDVSFPVGFNGIGFSYRPSYVDVTMSSTAGAGLTGSGFTSPNQFTIEAIVKADAKTSGSAVNYIFQTRPGSDRGYYLIQDEDGIGRTSVGGLGSIIGNNFGDVGLGAEYESDGTWIYIAAAIDLTSTAGMASADIYAAELTEGGAVATPVLVADDRTWNTADPSALAGATGIFGIGNFAIDRDGDTIAEASQEWFQGAIDHVRISDGLLSVEQLQANLALQYVPEPTGLALLSLGGLLALARRRS